MKNKDWRKDMNRNIERCLCCENQDCSLNLNKVNTNEY